MRTALFAPCYLDGTDPQGNSRFERMMRWLNWYRAMKDDLGFELIFLSDNCSSKDKILPLINQPDIKGVINEPHLGGGGHVRYPYCWRHLYAIEDCIELGFEKIICIDTDAFIVSRSLSQFVHGLTSGWTSFHERRWNFPTAEFHILCKDSFWIYQEFTAVPFMSHMGKLMETSLPFTDIRHEFHCERSGEEKAQQTTHDLYAQANLQTELIYR